MSDVSGSGFSRSGASLVPASGPAPTQIDVGDAAEVGVATTGARADHQHALPVPDAPVNVTKATASAGAATTVARADHKHDVTTAAAGAIAVADAASEGSASSLARSDHRHSLAAPSAPANVTKATSSAGSSGNVARQDHKHDIDTATAIAVGPTSAEGSSSSLARADHTHAVTDLAIASQAHGDLLYRAASAWLRLAAGTAGAILKTLGAGAAPAWVKPYSGSVSGTTSGPTQTANAYAYPGEVLEEMTLTGTFTGGPVSITFRGTFALASTLLNSDGVEVTIYVDGAELDVKHRQGFLISGVAMTLSNVALTCGALTTLSAGSHTIAVLWRRTGSQASVAAVANQRQLIVVETV